MLETKCKELISFLVPMMLDGRLHGKLLDRYNKAIEINEWNEELFRELSNIKNQLTMGDYH